VKYATRLRGAFICGHTPHLRGDSDEQLAAGCADATHRLPTLRRVGGSAGKLGTVYLLVQLGLLHADIFPIHVELFGDEHGQHVAHALA